MALIAKAELEDPHHPEEDREVLVRVTEVEEDTLKILEEEGELSVLYLKTKLIIPNNCHQEEEEGPIKKTKFTLKNKEKFPLF